LALVHTLSANDLLPLRVPFNLIVGVSNSRGESSGATNHLFHIDNRYLALTADPSPRFQSLDFFELHRSRTGRPANIFRRAYSIT